MQDTVLAAYICTAPGVMPSVVAAHFGVSVRTVRSYVRRANDAMRGFASIDLARGSGYRLLVEDQEAFDAWLRSASGECGADVPQTPGERVSYLLNDLLVRSDWITIDELADILYVSRSVLSGDMKDVERTLGRFGLELERRPHYGIRATGPEMARRVCLASLVMADYGGEAPDGPLGEEHLIEDVARCVDRAIEEASYQINSIAYQNLLVHIAVAIMRIRDDCRVSMPVEHLASIKGSREYPIACQVARLIATDLSVELPDEEVAYIAIHLAGKQTLADDGADEGVVISDEVWSQVSEMLECVWSVYRFDFRNDLELRMNLARHLVPLTVRLQYHMNLKNPLLSDIKVRYPLAYAMAVDASAVLAERCGTKMSEDETGYIALAFALALERQKTGAPKKNIVLVCASGAGSARLLEYRCRQEFGAYVGTITTCDVLDLGKIDYTAVDYVFSTVPIGQALPVPVREVKYFLDAAEVQEMKELLRSGDAAPSGLLRYFDRRLFFPHIRLGTKREVLDFLLGRAAAVRDVAPGFAQLVWRREETVATSFGNGVAMPHPLEPAGSETFVCVGLLDEPVVWDDYGRDVQVVFLSSFADADALELPAFYAALADMLVSRSAMAALAADQTWDTLETLLAAFSSGR